MTWMLMGDFITAIANAWGTTAETAGLIVSFIFIGTLIIIALASKMGIEGLFVVSFMGVLLFTGIGWIATLYGVGFTFVIAIMAAVWMSKISNRGGGD